MYLKEDIIRIQHYESPCGKILLGEINGALCFCSWVNIKRCERNCSKVKRLLRGEYREETSALLRRTAEELDEYFAGTRKGFDIPVQLVGTDFQRRIWNALLTIPYAETRSYIDIGKAIGNPKGVRAVAQAIGANPLCIVVPCHRVIGADGSLTGFAGGLEAKRFLLELESR